MVRVHVCLKMANSVFVVFVAVILLQIGTGKNIRWIKNSNWNNVDNWSLGRLPCKGDITSFSQVTPQSGQKPLIYFNANSTIRKLVLPRNSKIVLKRSITIRLAANESCEISSNAIPIVATDGEVNNFIGVRANKWECPENWAADDNSFIGNAPCGNDVPVFPSDSAFSYVTSGMDPISVKFVLIRSFKPSDFRPYDDELLLNFSLNPNCGSNANLCPCIRAADGCSMSASNTLSIGLSTMTPTNTISATSSISTIKSSLESSTSSFMTQSKSLLTSSFIHVPGNVGITSFSSIPNPHHTSGSVGPIISAAISNKGDDSGGSNVAVIGAIVGIIVVLAIVAIIIVVIIIIIVRKRRYGETKHRHLEEDDHAFAAKESGTASYDNPAYECNLSIHSANIDQMENPLF